MSDEDEEATDDAPDDKPTDGAAETSRSPARRVAPATISRIAESIRARGRVQRRQGVYCLALIAALLIGGGVFFYFAQAIALAELREQSDFLAKKRAALDTDQLKSKQLQDDMLKQRGLLAGRAPEVVTAKSVQIGTLPSGLHLRRVFFSDAAHGWAVGKSGTILSTADGGAHWKIHASGVQNDLFDVRFTDASHGWAVGAKGVILATSNQGETWTKIDSQEADIYALRFVGKTGWAVGAKGLILLTTDGGAEWSRVESAADVDLYDLSFADAEHGWAVGDKGVVLATANAGVIWRQNNSGVATPLVGVQFTDAQHGVAVGFRGTIVATSDGGASWRKRDSGVSRYLDDVVFTDPSHGFVVGESGTLLATADGGESWQKRDSGVDAYFHGVAFADAKRGVAVGDNGAALAIASPQFIDKLPAAATASDLRPALAEAQIDANDALISPYIAAFSSDDTNKKDVDSRIADEQTEIAAYTPKDTKEETAYSLFNNPMFLSNLNRIGITIYAFFAISIVVAIYRYTMRLSAHYDACADAIELSEGTIEGDLNQLIQSLSPGKIDFGKVNSPVDRAIDALQSAFRAGKAA